MSFRSIISKSVAFSLALSSAIPAYAATASEVGRTGQQEQLKKLLRNQIEVNNFVINQDQLAIEKARDYGIIADPNLIKGMNLSTIGALVSGSVALGSGALYLASTPTERSITQKAYVGARELNDQLFQILTKSGNMFQSFHDLGPADYTVQTEFKELSPQVKKQVLNLLKESGSKHSKEELNAVYKALQIQVNSVYRPLQYIADANETHWQSAVRRARLRGAGRYAAIVAGVVAISGGALLMMAKHTRQAEKDDSFTVAILNNFVKNKNQQGALEYVTSCIEEMALLNANNAAIEKRITSLK